MFSGLADWQLLLKAAEKSRLPIIGSGDLFEPETAIAALRQNSLSGIMLGRGTLGRPWLFREIKEALKNNPPAKPGPEEKRLAILTHSRLLQEVYGDRTGLLLYRKHLAWYSRGICGAAAFRKELFTLTSMTELNQKVENLFS
ncbi:MAG: tRNA-dihydrouridine synthase, partial [Deltaproteobacteria bacterium]|nr:tRNA-dihydrouridine synthase [Deltaproteobacteria bacterium]